MNLPCSIVHHHNANSEVIRKLHLPSCVFLSLAKIIAILHFPENPSSFTNYSTNQNGYKILPFPKNILLICRLLFNIVILAYLLKKNFPHNFCNARSVFSQFTQIHSLICELIIRINSLTIFNNP